MKYLFVDASAWIAISDQSDKYHQISVEAFQNLQGQAVQLFTSDYILDETITHLLYSQGHRVAVEFGNWVRQTKRVQIIHIDEQIWGQAWEMFQQYRDKEWAFTDVTSFILMREHGIWDAFTFDHHFTQAGFILYPSL